MKKSKFKATFLKPDFLKLLGFTLLAIVSVIGVIAISGHPSKKLMLIAAIIILAITTLLYFAIKKKWSLERLFLILAIPLGLFYLFVIPVGRVADEPSHFLRAYEVSRGGFISETSEDGGGRELSARLEEAINNDSTSYRDYAPKFNIVESGEDEKPFVNFYNTSIYFFTCYLPQAIGIFIGNLFGAPILICAYLGRLCNLLFFILVVFFSIKKSPVLKSAIFFVSLIPMTLHQAASLSSDVMTYATAVGLFAFVLYHLFDKSKKCLTVKDYVIMCLLCVFLGMCKYAYLPLCLLILLIPAEKFKCKKNKYWTIGLLAGGIIILNIVWFFLTRNFFHQREGVDAVLQLKYVLGHPLGFISALFDLIFKKGCSIVETMFGSSLEWLDVGIGNLPILIIIIAFCIFVYRHKNITISPTLKYLSVFIVLIITTMFIGIEYLTWTPVGAGYVDGIQGRYFLPFLFMFPLLFMKTSKKRSETKSSIIELQRIDNGVSLVACQFLIVINLIAIVSIYVHHLPI